MPAAPRPYESSRTYRAATALDHEPHVFTLTVHAPTWPIRFRSPRSLARSLLVASTGYLLHERYTQATGRTRAFHMIGHAMAEVKSVAPDGHLRYLLAAVTEAGDGQTAKLMLREHVGYSLAAIGTRGRIEPFDEVARDIDEAAETRVRAVRVRFLISAGAAERMLAFFDEFARRRIHETYSLAGLPLDGTGAGCTSFVVAFLEAAGLLDDDWKDRWTVRLRVPEELFGDPARGDRVPPRRLLFGPRVRRWATAGEPHRLLAFYDTAAMYDWASGLAADRPTGPHSESDRVLSRHLGMPVVTIDLRGRPVPSGPIFR